MTVELHVGYVGVTREGDRVEILNHAYPESRYGYFVGNNNACYWANGIGERARQLKTDIIGPWVEPETQEPGPWIGWNGGDCPVHPKSTTSFLPDIGLKWTGRASSFNWVDFRGAYRVIKEYKDPLELWFKYDSLDGWHECTEPEEGAVMFREVTE